jgi:hypothetical protein
LEFGLALEELEDGGPSVESRLPRLRIQLRHVADERGVVGVHLGDRDRVGDLFLAVLGLAHTHYVEVDVSGDGVGGEQEPLNRSCVNLTKRSLELPVFVRLELLVHGGDAFADLADHGTGGHTDCADHLVSLAEKC